MDSLYEFSKSIYESMIRELDESPKVQPQYYTSIVKKKEYYENVDAITRVGIMNNQQKISDLIERLQVLESKIGDK